MPSYKFKNVYIDDYYTIAGEKENKVLKNNDMVINDYYFNCKTFESAEMKMQKIVIDNLINKNNIDYIIGGDLINQISISTNNAKRFDIPFIGIYSACATFIEGLILSSIFIDGKKANNIICITSSHNLTAERQFRYPSEYGNCKPKTATSTATGAVGAIVTNNKTNIKITEGTIGKVVDLGVNDVNHMGAVMAPACADTLYNHLKNLDKKHNDYDLIITGDLGCVGLDILKEYYNAMYKVKLNNIVDAGCYLHGKGDTMYSGSSGPCCLPLVFFSSILKNKKYKKILLLGTGSLHSPVLVNQHQTIPSICHAACIEVL